MDWLAQIKELGDLGVKMARDIPSILANPDLTLEQATALYQSVEKKCQEMDDLMGRLDSAEVDDALYEAGGAAQEIWDELGEATANRMIELRGR